jgi:predicted PurR-regulated permease PerM
MTSIQDEDGRIVRNVRGIALALLLIGCLVVVWPFITAILWAVVLTFTTWPIYRRLLVRMGGRQTWAALTMTLGMLLILVGPFVIVGFTLRDEVRDLAAATRSWMEAGPPDPPAWVGRIPIVGSSASAYWARFAGDSRALLAELKRLIEPAAGMLLSWGLALAKGIVELTLSILVAFFLYRDGVWVAQRADEGAHRIAGERGRHLLELAGRTVRSVVYGILGTALVQGVLAGLGFVVVRAPGAIVLALLTFFLSVIPLGPPLIWIPVTIWLFYKVSIGWGIFMLIWGLLISSADNVVKPWLISQGSKMPFILIFFGVIGGAMTFGLVGVFLGPTLLAVGYRIVQEWLKTPGAIEAVTAEKVEVIG